MTKAREPIMEAMLDLSFAQGYTTVTIAQICERAGVRREDFDACFASMEACALALLEELAEDNLRAVQTAYDGEMSWPDSLRAGAYAEANWINANPKQTRFGMIEMLSAGELTRAFRDSFFERYMTMIDAGREVAKDPEAIPASTAEAVIGSIIEMLTKRLQRGEVDAPQEYIPELMYLAVRPYLGEAAARRELSIPPPHRRDR